MVNDPHRLAEALRQQAAQLGFSHLGIVPAEPARRLDVYINWLTMGYQGEMAYMGRPDRVERRQNLHVILPGVRSLVVAGLDYYTARPPAHIATDPGRGRISNYAWGQDYHDVMEPRLTALGDWLQRQAPGSASRAYVDTGAILERDHGETAGLGFTGKNTMLIAPRRGSWFFLGVLLTTAVLAPVRADPQPMPSCGNCRRCLDACPTNAFPEPYVLDARRCISYLTIELKGWIPTEMRPLMGNWLYGCDVCQEVCPFNRFALPSAEPAFQASDWNAAAPPLADILRLDEAGFGERFATSPIRRIKRARLVRNACVAAGNWGDPAIAPALAALLADPEPLIRGHAAWALRRIGGNAAFAAVRAAQAMETDERVRQEMSGL